MMINLNNNSISLYAREPLVWKTETTSFPEEGKCLKKLKFIKKNPHIKEETLLPLPALFYATNHTLLLKIDTQFFSQQFKTNLCENELTTSQLIFSAHPLKDVWKEATTYAECQNIPSFDSEYNLAFNFKFHKGVTTHNNSAVWNVALKIGEYSIEIIHHLAVFSFASDNYRYEKKLYFPKNSPLMPLIKDLWWCKKEHLCILKEKRKQKLTDNKLKNNKKIKTQKNPPAYTQDLNKHPTLLNTSFHNNSNNLISNNNSFNQNNTNYNHPPYNFVSKSHIPFNTQNPSTNDLISLVLDKLFNMTPPLSEIIKELETSKNSSSNNNQNK